METIKRNNYILHIYNPQNIEDKKFIKTHRKFLYAFLNDGYIYAGLGSFKSCINADALAKNTVLLKIAEADNNIIAVSIYSGRNSEYKNVGITATTDTKYRSIGTIAAKDIIKDDINAYDQFYWTICSGPLYTLCKKYNAIAIPNEYAHIIDDRLIPDNTDEYAVYIDLHDDNEPYKKWIFGFNSKELYDTIVNKNDERVLSIINGIKRRTDPTQINESIEWSYNYYDAIHRIVNVLYDERTEVSSDITPKIKNILLYCIKCLQKYIKSNPYSKRASIYKLDIENAHDIIKWSNIVELHKL